MNWWIVTGRIPYDDEDSLEVIKAETEDGATQTFKNRLLGYRSGKSTEQEDGKEVVYINWIVSCGEQEPEVTLCPQ